MKGIKTFQIESIIEALLGYNQVIQNNKQSYEGVKGAIDIFMSLQAPFQRNQFLLHLQINLFGVNILFPLMDIAVNQIDFNVALNALQDEVLARLEQVNILQIEFLRQFQCHHIAPETHPSLVYNIRKILAIFQDVYQGVKGYFIDLNMEVTYELFRKIQVFMINGYNFLSRALLSHIDRSEEKRTIKENTKNREAMLMKHKQQKLNLSQNTPSRKLQHCDYTIGFFESQQAKITQQMHKVQESLLLSRQLIEKLIPSKAVKELTQIKEQAQITLQNTQKIFEQTYQLKYLQFKNYLSQMLKPEDIANQFCENVKNALHDRFTNGVKKSVNTLKEMIKNQQALLLREASVQTDDAQFQKGEKKPIISKNNDKMQNLLLKERRINQKLSANLELVKKQLQNCKLDKQRLIKELKQTKTSLTQTQQNYRILTKLYEERREELMQLQNSFGVQNKIIEDLRVYQWRFKNKESKEIQVQILPQRLSKEIQVKLEDEQQLIAAMRKRIEKMRSRILQLQLKKEKEDKVVPRKSKRQSKRQSKLSQSRQSVEYSQVQYELERNNARRKTQMKKRTLIGIPLLTQKNEKQNSENVGYTKKLSSRSSKMKLQMQEVILQQTKKRNTLSRISKFMVEGAIVKNSLKSISEVQNAQSRNQPNQYRSIATQTARFTRFIPQSTNKTDKSIQACEEPQSQSVSKLMMPKYLRTYEQPKALSSNNRQKSNELKMTLNQQSTISTIVKSKQNKQIKSFEMPNRKEKTFFKSVQDNFLEMQRSMLKNSTTYKKHHFELLNIQSQQNNGLVKRNIMQKNNKYLLNHKHRPSQKKNPKNSTFEQKCYSTAIDEITAYQKKECLINVDKINPQRSFDVDYRKETYKNQRLYSEPIEQQSNQ